ncbi:MAG: peptidoglycan bridge formation glycyltransferase FemA/FemB family protein [Ardenticatenaceae bacterium]|nr:peptidoglycan bridge formation glycyltransferase FemA/FemB family protein [Anaerolineales bacterium]MCB9006071.1 peptidoglycan bridge formation glycyltransferase FemA/FemB family protein [Ardenticatenaceae bacterium]
MIQQQEPTYRASTFKLEKSKAAWQQALAAMPGGHALQSWAWAEQKSRWGWTPLPLTLTIGESSWEPLATAMVLKRKIPRTPFCILYVPKGPALNYKDGALRRVVLAELENIARRERAIFIKIDPEVVKSWGDEVERPSPLGSKFTQELKSRGWRFSTEQIQFRNTVELDLTEAEENLLAAMKSKTRYNIRLAGRKEIVVRAGTEADFPTMAEMYAETAARDGFGIRPSAYYLDAWQSFHQAGMGHLLVAEFEDEPVAAVYLVRFGNRVIYMYGASTDKERQRMPNYLLQWEAIRWAKAQGCTVYDFWGAPDEFVESDRLWGVWRFKAGFNGQVVRHIGAWDFPVRPLLYQLYTVILPKYLNYLRGRKKA